ncbi:MAG: thiamine ABC transporter substrate-binding protein [Candidatus Promineifilaceae bacterium]|nr:thiamine ABC transporter substrate-binding protein [Candidatus Promineifilaceae bacterium]
MDKKPIILLILLVVLYACSGEILQSEPVKLRLMTHDSFDIGQETMAEFTEQTGIEVEIFKSGDAGAMVNKAVLAKDDPLADVLYGVDNTFLSRALINDIFIPYESENLTQVSEDLRLDPESGAVPVNFGDVCLNYDKSWFAATDLEPPENLETLVDPLYRGLTVVENPATSSPGLAFLLATISSYGEEGYLEYWQRLVDNDVLVTDGWEEAYYGAFTAASDGDRPIVVSYASSPPAEVYFAETTLDQSPTGAVVSPGSCFRQIEFAGILRGTDHEQEAQQLIDFMLGKTFQEDIPLHMFVYPVNQTAELPEVFKQFSEIPQQPANVPYQDIARFRESWVEQWTDVVLR